MLPMPLPSGLPAIRRRSIGARRHSRDNFLSGRDAHQAHDLRYMVADGKVGQIELAADFLVREARRQQLENVVLPGGQCRKIGERFLPVPRPCTGERRRLWSRNEPHVQVGALREIRAHLPKCRANGVEKRGVAPLDDKVDDRSRQLPHQRPGMGFEPAILRIAPPASKALTMDISQRPTGSRLLHTHRKELKSIAALLVFMNWQMANERLRMANQFCQWLFWTGEWRDGQTPIKMEHGMPVENDGPGYYSLRIVAERMQSRSTDDRQFFFDPVTLNNSHTYFGLYWKFV